MKRAILIVLLFIGGYANAKKIALPKGFLCSFQKDTIVENYLREIFPNADSFNKWNGKFFVSNKIYALEVYGFKKAGKMIRSGEIDTLNNPLIAPTGCNPDIKHFSCGVDKESHVIIFFSKIVKRLIEIDIVYEFSSQGSAKKYGDLSMHGQILSFLYEIKNDKMTLIESHLNYQ